VEMLIVDKIYCNEGVCNNVRLFMKSLGETIVVINQSQAAIKSQLKSDMSKSSTNPSKNFLSTIGSFGSTSSL